MAPVIERDGAGVSENGGKSLQFTSMKRKLPIFQAFVAACLFGVSAPFAKLLLGEMKPVLLASFLYLGSGIGLMIYKLIQPIGSKNSDKEAKIGRKDWPWLLGATLSGGIAAPIVLMISLKNTPAATASLLLNFEGVATALIAALAFKESVGRRIWSAVFLVTLASVLLSMDVTAKWGFSPWAVGILCACAFWGIDNNFTRNISAKDPVMIVAIKGTVAGCFSLFLAFLLGHSLPSALKILLALALGLFCYGLSILFFILSMRELGSARTSAYFASAPFIGTVLSFLIFRDPPNAFFIISLPIMALGAFLLFGEEHLHLHTHFETEHEHSHHHEDGHHLHEHPGTVKDQTHSHPHKHEELPHEHPHAPDIHHRHGHQEH
jgi:drug/metabolite transporter (DMT)-like permease